MEPIKSTNARNSWWLRYKDNVITDGNKENKETNKKAIIWHQQANAHPASEPDDLVNCSSPPCSPAFTAQHDVIRFGMSLVTVDELSQLCPHLQATHPAPGGSSQEAEILGLARAAQQKLKHWGVLSVCAVLVTNPGHSTRWAVLNQLHLSLTDTCTSRCRQNLSSSQLPQLKALPYTSPYSPHLGLGWNLSSWKQN